MHKWAAEDVSGPDRAHSGPMELIMKCAGWPVSLYLVVRTAT